MENKKMVLRKIAILDLLKILQHLYANGTDYIDIVGMSQGPGEQDEILIAVKDDYLNTTMRAEYLEDNEENFDHNGVFMGDYNKEEEEEEEKPAVKKEKAFEIRLTEKDINNLINGS